MLAIIVLMLAWAIGVTDAHATRYWVSPTGNDANACSAIDGDADPGVYRATPTGGVACMVGGDRLTILGGPAYTGINARIRNVPSGTVNTPTIIEGDPIDGHLCALQHTCKAIIRSSSSSIIRADYIIIRRIEFDGSAFPAANPLYIGGVGGTSGTCTTVLLESIETWNTQSVSANAASGIYEDAGCSFLTLRYVHSHHNGTTSTFLDHGAYLQGKDTIVEDSWFHDNANLGMQCFSSQASPNSRADRCIVRRSAIHDNLGVGLAIEGHDVQAYDNLIYRNGTGCIFAGYSGSPRSRIHNNTCVNNNQRSTSPGIWMGAASGSNDVSNSTVHNNIVIGHSPEISIGSGSSGLANTHNACTSAGSCGTSKIVITSAGQWLQDPTNGNFRLKAGANNLVDAGTAVSTRASSVGAPDIGAYERGLISSASIATGHIEVSTSTVLSGLHPASGITGVTIACVGCTGTPIADFVAVKPGASSVLLITVSGIASPGTCTISLGASNLTDSVFIGGLSTNAQPIDTITALSVSGTCQNTSGPSGGTGLIARYLLSDGSGTTAADSSGEANHGTVTGITWVDGGIYIPRDATYRHLEAPFGASTNPTTTSGATCANVEIEVGHSQGIVFSSGSSGTNQRLNYGWFTVGGQLQWGMSVQEQVWSNGSEFVAELKPTLVCMTWNASTDTAHLWVNGVKGSLTNKSVRTYTSFTTTATNLRYGNLGTGTINNGGMTIRDVFFWDVVPTDQELQDLYAELFPSSGSTVCYGQAAHKWESIHIANGEVVSLGAVNSVASVVENGAIALVLQVDCVGTGGAPVTLVAYYSEDGINFNLPIPAQAGSAGITLVGTTWESTNVGSAACCVSGALTPNNGSTLQSSSALPTIELSQNHSYTVRLLLRVGQELTTPTLWIRLKQDNGDSLAGGYTPSAGAQLNVVSAQASGGM